MGKVRRDIKGIKKKGRRREQLLGDIYFLMAKFLSAGPCKRAGQVLQEEIAKYKILPKRLDWQGNERRQTLKEYEKKYQNLQDSHLYDLCNNHVQMLWDQSALTGFPSILNGRMPPSAEQRQTAKYRLKKATTLRMLCCARQAFSQPSIEASQLKTKCLPAHNTVSMFLSREVTGNFLSTQWTGQYFYTDILRLYCRKLGHLSSVYCLLFDNTGKYMLTGADDHLVKIWSAIDGRLLATLRGSSAQISDMAINAENTLVAAGSNDKIIRVWSLQTTAPVAVLIGHSGTITSIGFCPSVMGNNKFLASTSGDGSVAFWIYTENKFEDVEFQNKPIMYYEKMRPGQSQMICVSPSPGGIFLAAGSADNHVRVYYMHGSQGPERVLEELAHTDRVDSIQWATRGLRFISGSRDGTALIWTLKKGKWDYLRLRMTQQTNVPPGDTKKLNVTMVSWAHNDRFVLTAVSKNYIRIWRADTGDHVKDLVYHVGEAYVIEPHPWIPTVFLSAGHDGRIVIWDLRMGAPIRDFVNSAAIFDAKWSPNGQSIAATDSEGHILMFGFGHGDEFKKIPEELFFHTDYRPLIRDPQQYVLDEQTQTAPHLMPPAFLVNKEGNPYPPEIQRLVPGRQKCRDEHLVPFIITAEGGIQEVVGDMAVAAPVVPPDEVSPSNRRNIAVRERHSSDNGTTFQARSEHSYARETPSSSRQSPSSQNRSLHPVNENTFSSEDPTESVQSRGACIAFRTTNVIELLTDSAMQQSILKRQALGDEEMAEYEICNTISIPVNSQMATVSETEGNRKEFIRQLRKRQIERKRSRAGATNTRATKTVTASRGTEVQGVNSADSMGNALATHTGSTNQTTEPAISPTLTENMTDSDFEISETEAAVIEESNSSSSSSSSDSGDSSEYSDWTAEVGVSLEPPKRSHSSRRKPHRIQRLKTTRRNGTVEDTEDEDNCNDTEGECEDKGEEKSTATGSRKQPPRSRKKVNTDFSELSPLPDDFEFPEIYRPALWLSEVVPRKAPYYPQMGDEVMYFRQGNQMYIQAVKNKKTYEITNRSLPWAKQQIREQELVRVIGIRYEIRPPRLCCLRLAVIDPETGALQDPTFTVKYHDMPDVLDFFVLRQAYDIAVSRNWNPGDHFRCMIDDSWWLGVIETQSPYQEDCPDSPFLCFNVKWDNGEYERMSPWDLEPISADRLPPTPGGQIQVLPGEISDLLYQPTVDEWPNGDRDSECDRIASCYERVMKLPPAKAFVTPVDLNAYPHYAMIIEYPIDLGIIKNRLVNRFYRRINAIQFDVRYIATNAEMFNKKGALIVSQARMVTELCLRIIRDKNSPCEATMYQDILRNYRSSSDEELDGKSRQENWEGSSQIFQQRDENFDENLDWRETCQTILERILDDEDSAPFRNPVERHWHPDYYNIVVEPIDLGTIKTKLNNGTYNSPMEFKMHMEQLILNSKVYNTNKRSKIFAMTERLSKKITKLMDSMTANSSNSTNSTVSNVELEERMVNNSKEATQTHSSYQMKRGKRISKIKSSPKKSQSTSPAKIVRGALINGSEINQKTVKTILTRPTRNTRTKQKLSSDSHESDNSSSDSSDSSASSTGDSSEDVPLANVMKSVKSRLKSGHILNNKRESEDDSGSSESSTGNSLSDFEVDAINQTVHRPTTRSSTRLNGQKHDMSDDDSEGSNYEPHGSMAKKKKITVPRTRNKGQKTVDYKYESGTEDNDVSNSNTPLSRKSARTGYDTSSASSQAHVLSVSSRGRIRKLNERMRAFLIE